MKIHNVFNVTRLSPHIEDSIPGRKPTKPPPVITEQGEEWAVEKILNAKIEGRGKRRFFLVRWEGYTRENETWEPFEMLNEDVPEMIEEFYRTNPKAPGAPGSSSPPARSSGRRRRT